MSKEEEDVGSEDDWDEDLVVLFLEKANAMACFFELFLRADSQLQNLSTIICSRNPAIPTLTGHNVVGGIFMLAHNDSIQKLCRVSDDRSTGDICTWLRGSNFEEKMGVVGNGD